MDISMKEVMERYGPTLALIGVLVLLVILLPSNVHGGGTNAASTSGVGQTVTAGTDGQALSGAAGSTSGGATGAAGSTGSTGSTASGASGSVQANSAATPGASDTGSLNPTTVTAQTGKYPCRPDGRQLGISKYMPPCMQYDGHNDGATARGVFPNYIKVAYYVPQPNAATQAALKAAGAGDDQATIDRAIEVLRHYYNNFYQTYGREVRFTKVNASGAQSDDVAAKADAHAIAAAGYFATFTAAGTTGNPTFDATVGQLGVICLACSVSQANSFYQRTADYNYGALPSAREYYQSIGEYWGKRLVGNGRKAKYAGAPASSAQVDLRTKPRKFGLIWLNANAGTVDPGAQEERDNFINNILPKYGISGVVDASYNYDITQGPTEAQTIIAKMNASNVTTIALFTDPLFPIFFTKEAAKEQYSPEWFITGTGLTDTTFFERTYDQTQWVHAYGMSPLWVFFLNEQVSDGYREYHEACPPLFTDQSNCADRAEGVGINVWRTALLELFTGIQMAGQHLNPQTFAQGEFKFPVTGGTPAYPLWHMTPESPNIIKDFTEVYWNPNGSGKDEVNNNSRGILMKANKGKRYLIGQWPTADPSVFGSDPSPVFTSDANYSGTGPPAGDTKHPASEKCMSCS